MGQVESGDAFGSMRLPKVSRGSSVCVGFEVQVWSVAWCCVTTCVEQRAVERSCVTLCAVTLAASVEHTGTLPSWHPSTKF